MFAYGLKRPVDDLRNQLKDLLAQERERRALSRDGAREAGAEGNEEINGCVSVFSYLEDTIVGVPAEIAAETMRRAVEIFARAGHTVHPGKSACWSHSAEVESLPAVCQRIWRADGLKVAGIPVFNAANEPVLAREMLEKRLNKISDEAEFLSSVLFSLVFQVGFFGLWRML